jgi:hypothetical protein
VVLFFLHIAIFLDMIYSTFAKLITTCLSAQSLSVLLSGFVMSIGQKRLVLRK